MSPEAGNRQTPAVALRELRPKQGNRSNDQVAFIERDPGVGRGDRELDVLLDWLGYSRGPDDAGGCEPVCWYSCEPQPISKIDRLAQASDLVTAVVVPSQDAGENADFGG